MDWFAYLLVRAALSLVQAVSMETCHSVARALAYLFYDLLRLRRAVTDENLQHALPNQTPRERDLMARRMWEHLLLMVMEIAHAPRKIHETNWRRYIQMTNKRQLVDLMLQPRPKVIVTAHFGNFEIAGYVAGLLGIRTYTIARSLDNQYLDQFLNSFRESKGQFILPKVGSAPQADAVLDSGGSLVLLGDQHAGPKGCWVKFMGRPTSCHKALALFTLISSAPMALITCQRVGKPLHFNLALIDVADPLAPRAELAGVKQLTQWYNDVLEQEIRNSPEQYWWLHRRWRDDEPKSKRQLAELRAAGEAETPPPLERSAA